LRRLRVTFLAAGLCATLSLTGCPSQDQGPSAAPPSAALASTPPAASVAPAPAASPTPPEDEVVATINGIDITNEEFEKPLVEAFGLNMLLKVVELNLARQQAQRMGIMVTQSDVAAEMQRYLDQVFRDDRRISELRDDADRKSAAGKAADAEDDHRQIHDEQQRLLSQLLDNQKLTRTEFNLAIEATTFLRAVVQPAVAAKLTDDNLQESFRARYGEKVQVRHIACANLQEIAEVKRHLAAGEPFPQVAQLLSRNRQTAALGGELQPFSRSTAGLPQVFKDAAFALKKPGDISDPVEADGAYHLIQLVDRIPPTAVKFEDVKQSVREDLAEALTEASVRDLRNQLAQEAVRHLQIRNPVLAQQFEDKLTQRDTEIRDRNLIREELKRERPTSVPSPSTGATSNTSAAAAINASAPGAATATEPTPQATAAPASTSSTRP
jgi:parvulin-like peptidyl-prolyl isomerase